MELVVRKTDLLRELQLFQGIVERKNTIPILANVLLEANGTEVKMLATDLEVGLRSKCPATVSKSGSVGVIVRTVNGGAVDMRRQIFSLPWAEASHDSRTSSCPWPT